MIRDTLLFLCLLCIPSPVDASGQDRPAQAPAESIISSVDIPAWAESRRVTVRHPKLAVGTLVDLFDARPATAALCADKGPATFELFFREPLDVHQIGISPCRGAAYRWQAFFSAAPDREGRFAFQPLVALRNADGGKRDPVRIARGRKVHALRIVVERMTNGENVLLSGLEIYGEIGIGKLEVVPPADPLVAGGCYRFDVTGLDPHGGRTRLEKGLKWTVFPQKKIVTIERSGILRALAPGKVEVRVAFGKLKHKPLMINIAPPAPAPGGLLVVPGRTAAAIRADFELPPDSLLLVYRRADGAPTPELPVHRSPAPVFNDARLLPDTTYHYAAALADRHGTVMTERTPEMSVHTLAADAPSCLTVSALHVIVPIYARDLDVGETAEILTGLRLAREFHYRNSLGRLVLLIHPLLLDAPLPTGAGPPLLAVEHDLVARGILGKKPTLVHVIGPGCPLNCGGMELPNGGAISFGCSASAPAAFPGGPWSPLALDACWTFIHEIQHSLDEVVDEAIGASDMLHGHFHENFPLPDGAVFDAGEFYDGQAAILRTYRHYEAIGEHYGTRLETADSDGDGLPDTDARWPFDEKRLGTKMDAADSDGDGLTDLAELCAGIYEGSDPAKADSDGDGAPDGEDRFPLSDFSGTIPHGTPAAGALPAGVLSSGVSFRSLDHAPDDVTVHAAWDEKALSLGFDTAAPCRVEIHLDGSGRLGPFATDRVVITEDGKQGSDVFWGESSLRVVFAEPVLLMGDQPVAGASVSSWKEGERHRLVVRIPAETGRSTERCHFLKEAVPAKGLTLEAGRVIGINVTVAPLEPPIGTEGTTEAFATLYELHRFYDAVLKTP